VFCNDKTQSSSRTLYVLSLHQSEALTTPLIVYTKTQSSSRTLSDFECTDSLRLSLSLPLSHKACMYVPVYVHIYIHDIFINTHMYMYIYILYVYIHIIYMYYMIESTGDFISLSLSLLPPSHTACTFASICKHTYTIYIYKYIYTYIRYIC